MGRPARDLLRDLRKGERDARVRANGEEDARRKKEHDLFVVRSEESGRCDDTPRAGRNVERTEEKMRIPKQVATREDFILAMKVLDRTSAVPHLAEAVVHFFEDVVVSTGTRVTQLAEALDIENSRASMLRAEVDLLRKVNERLESGARGAFRRWFARFA
jgi:hypothetical protein